MSRTVIDPKQACAALTSIAADNCMNTMSAKLVFARCSWHVIHMTLQQTSHSLSILVVRTPGLELACIGAHLRQQERHQYIRQLSNQQCAHGCGPLKPRAWSSSSLTRCGGRGDPRNCCLNISYSSSSSPASS